MNKKFIQSLILVSVAAFLVGKPERVFAACEPTYGGGQNCIFNKSFDIEKRVRKEGDNEWKSKITDVKKGEIVEFKITVKNTGETEVDKMKMTDYLPDELEKTGGSGLTEKWDDFEPGEKKSFTIKAKVKDSEFDNKGFEKCVVNKSKVEYDEHDEGKDTATVCFGSSKITELPKTGSNSVILFTLAGISLIVLGFVFKRRFAFSRQ